MGAGVQSTALMMLAAEGRIPSFDFAIFADTGWEPKEVYAHLERVIREIAEPAGIPVIKVSNGDLRLDSLSEDYTTVLPLFLRNPDGGTGLLSRQCTQNYKLLPIYRYVRKCLGAAVSSHQCNACKGAGVRVPPSRDGIVRGEVGECSVCRGSGSRERVGPISHDCWPVTMAIGFSVDEVERVAPSRRRYVTHEYPLLDLGWAREDALGYLADRGFESTPRSACVGCPYHSDREWIRLREQSPDEWLQAIAFDAEIRHAPGSSGLRGQAFLHRRLLPLAEAVDQGGDSVELPGCSPFGCRSAAGVGSAVEEALLDRDELVDSH